MKRLLVLPLAVTLIATLARGETPQGPPAPARPPRIFVSPAGEPFRPAPGAPPPFETWFARADADHDGRLTRDEFRADAARFFKVLDVNGDGVVDGFEITNYEKTILPELAQEAEGRFARPSGGGQGPGSGGGGHGGRGGGRHGRGEGGGGGHGGGEPRGDGRPGGMQSLLNEPEPVTGADLNVDGRVTLPEMLRAADSRFDQLDQDSTGFLSREALRDRLEGKPSGKTGRGKPR